MHEHQHAASGDATQSQLEFCAHRSRRKQRCVQAESTSDLAAPRVRHEAANRSDWRTSATRYSCNRVRGWGNLFAGSRNLGVLIVAISLLPLVSLQPPSFSKGSISAPGYMDTSQGFFASDPRRSGRRDRGDTLDLPTFTTDPPAKPAMVAPSHGVEVTITHVDQDAVIYYSVAGEKPKCDDPAGTEYSQPLKLCGSSDQATIEAVACKAGPHAAASEVATQILNIRALSAPSPKAPTFDTVPADACREGADGALSCNSGGLFRVLLDSDEFSCSNPDWDTQADCLGMGFQWNPMLGCSELNGKRLPCITIYYTVDGSDPSVSSSSR